jgi:TonB family protein
MVATQSPTVAAADALSAPSDESLQVESVRGGSQAGRASGRFPDFDVLPLLRVPPHYPKAALEVGLEGAVTVEFTITEGGSVEDIVVVDSTDSVFEGPAMLAISRWKYLPRVIGGEFVATPDVRTILRFVLEADAALAAKLAREPPPPDRPGGIEFDEFEALVEPAWECLAAQDLRCAELVLDEVMATYELDRSQAALIWEFYGYIFTQYGDYGRAIAAYETAIGQGGATHVHLAHLYFERGQYDMALRMLLRYAEEIESRGGRLSSGIIEFIDRLRVLGITEEVL